LSARRSEHGGPIAATDDRRIDSAQLRFLDLRQPCQRVYVHVRKTAGSGESLDAARRIASLIRDASLAPLSAVHSENFVSETFETGGIQLLDFDGDQPACDRTRRRRAGTARTPNGPRGCQIERDQKIDVDAAPHADEEVDAIVRIRLELRPRSSNLGRECFDDRDFVLRREDPNAYQDA